MTTDVSTALPDITLAPGTTITVDTLDAAAVITLLNVYVESPPADETDEGLSVYPLFAYGPGG